LPLAGAACSTPSKGGLVLAISTDMQAPKDVDVISVYITTNGVPKFNYLGRVLPDGTVALPSTLAIVEPDSQSAQVRIRVIAFQTQAGGGANARVLRDVLTTVPHQAIGLLRVPLNFLDDGSGRGTLSPMYTPGDEPDGGKTHVLDVPEGLTQFDPDSIQSSCDWAGSQQTSINGMCTSATVDSSTLPPYADAEVYGDAGLVSSQTPASCLDVASCFANATPVTNLDSGACTFALPAGADPSTLNVALVSPATGTCLASGCYLPIPNDPTEGWTVQNQLVQLLPGVCAKIASGATLATAQGCLAEPLSQPVCQPGEVGASPDAGSPEGGEADGSPADATAPDASLPDAGPSDADVSDSTFPDSMVADVGVADSSATDASMADSASDGGPDATLGPPALTVSPNSGMFGLVPIGMPSSNIVFTVSNVGQTASGPLGVSLSGPNSTDFVVSPNTCTTALSVGAMCSFGITFTPAAVGAATGVALVAATGASTVNVPLSGTGM
jgi:hypothetical protein